MKEMIDRLGEIRDTIRALKKEEEGIISQLQEIEVGKTVYGERYELKVGEIIQTEIDPIAVRQFLKDDKKFMSIVSITKKDAAKVLLQPDIERFSVPVGSSKRFTTQKR
jgi:hypothetical protein